MDSRPCGYVGRFAPSPTGPLHAGSLATALASRLDALAHGGRWLLRIEDIDRPREMPGSREAIVSALETLGFEPDGPVIRQSRQSEHYEQAFARLLAAGRVYPCACTRREIADSLTLSGERLSRHGELVYPGTCRNGLPAGRAPRAWRLRVDDALVSWHDRHGSRSEERIASDVGDFVLRRADGIWAYQLAVVVDDALQGVTDVVRGEDLAGSTARQILLQGLLGLRTPRYLHLPVVRGPDGEKLSKQNGAAEIDTAHPLLALQTAARHLLGKPVEADTREGFWPAAVATWRESRWMKTLSPCAVSDSGLSQSA